MSRLVRMAQLFAQAAHGATGQVRRYTGEPYIEHPAEVVALLKRAGVTDDAMLAAAWLHDVVEDTAITNADIVRAFGGGVGAAVHELTDVCLPSPDRPRRVRVRINREHSASAHPRVKTIKCADLISNTRSIREHDPKFWPVYRAEALALLDVLRDCSHPALWRQLEEELQE